MRKRDQAIIVLHGAIVLMVGNLFGFPLGSAIESGAASAQGWTSAHAAVTGGGVMLVAMGAALHLVSLGARGEAWLRWSLIAVGYGAIVGLGVGAATGMRGFTPTGPLPNFVAFLGNMCVVFGSLIGVGLFGWGVYGTASREG